MLKTATDARIFVAVACRNRKEITAACLPTLKASLQPQDWLCLWNDASTEYGPGWLRQYGDEVATTCRRQIGIDRQRELHFREFGLRRHRFDFLYLTDADAIHDPEWRSEALAHAYGTNLPVCLYNTPAHRQGDNDLEERETFLVTKHAPGISMLFNWRHVIAILEGIGDEGGFQNWDWDACRHTGNRFCTLKTSYVDHIGLGGLHHPPGAGPDEGDRALNPTPYLISKRAEIVASLRAETFA